VGTDAAAILESINLLLSDNDLYRQMSQAHNPYGDGKACERILESLGLRSALPAFALAEAAGTPVA
jgi:UDP-N-acetylglucosamine 2-epimerase